MTSSSCLLRQQLESSNQLAPGAPMCEDGGPDTIEAAIGLFDQAFGEGSIRRKLIEQNVRHSPDGDGYVGRRIVQYDGGAFDSFRAS